MKAGHIQLQISATNLWWRSESWASEDPDLRAARTAPFAYRAGVLDNLTPGGLHVLRGPRRVGKSTEIKQAIASLIAVGTNPRSIVHAAVDGWRAEDLPTLVGTASASFLAGVDEPRYWFLDEITSVKGDWPSVIKNLRDNDPRFALDTVVLTGSSAAGLHEARKALAGRRGDARDPDRALLPMRFTDLVATTGLTLPRFDPVRAGGLADPASRELVDVMLPYLADLVPLWEAYLRVGGFPQSVAGWRLTGEPLRSFADALWDVVHGDAITSARFAAAQTLTLLSGLTRNLCSPLNVSDLARDLDVAQTTATERLTDLANNFLIWPCYREQDQRPRPAAQRKWYFIDPLVARLAALHLGTSTLEPDLTQLSQQQIGLCLLRNVGAKDAISLADFDAVLHHRAATGSEIDFVSAELGRVAVESKYADDRFGAAIQTVRATRRFAIIASRSAVAWHEDAWVIPAPILALILGG